MTKERNLPLGKWHGIDAIVWVTGTHESLLS
jgi:hypothetical protein